MDTTEKITRRGAVGLVLAGLTLPASKALATHHRAVDAHIVVDATGVVVTTISGEIFTAEFACDLRIASGGGARGSALFKRFGIFSHYVAEVGGLDVDEAGVPFRAWALMRERLSDGQLAQDWALASCEPSAVKDVYITYDWMAPALHHEPVQFAVPGHFEIGQR